VLASSERYKTDVASMGSSSEKLAQLRPVTFHLKTDSSGELQYGLIAEEVAKVYPELVIRGAAGAIEGVRYEELCPMLLNEVQQQRRTIEEQSQEVAALEQELSDAVRRSDAAQAAFAQQLSDVLHKSEAMQAALERLQGKDARVAMR